MPGAEPRRAPKRGSRSGGAGAAAPASRDARTPPGWAKPTPQAAGFDERAAFDLLQQLLTGRRELIGKLRPDRQRRASASSSIPPRMSSRRSAQHAGIAVADRRPAQPARHQADAARAGPPAARRAAPACRARTTTPSNCWACCTGRSSAKCATDAPAAPAASACRCRCCGWRCRTAASSCAAQHPARQLLNAVAESGARWLDEDDVDPQLLRASCSSAVDHVVENYDGDAAVFEAANQRPAGSSCSSHGAQGRDDRAPPCRGRARQGKAGDRQAPGRRDASTEIVGEQRLPKFVRALLNQAWADVLTLTLLRHGEDSDGVAAAAGDDPRRSSPPAAGRGGQRRSGSGEPRRGRAGAGRLPRRRSRARSRAA